MSTTIDQRVAELRFDNSHFEKNVATSMSTLDKLKQKLNLTGASKGLENIGSTVNKIDMNPLGRGVEAVSAKFSALQVMGITALSNITNQAVNAGKRIAASLTIDPVKTGFSEYELKMGSIQTIMASTGESLETVNEYLNELNEYSDKTIYSFSDMTQNIGKFTNAGVKLEDAVLAIKGISNEAAVSGANANEASRAMYNFAQALSSGFVKLIDWKSIENANMATVEFKQQLIDTAVEVGTLTKRADGLYDVTNIVSNAAASVLSPTKNFNDSLANQWMTTDVLIKTLRDYADETTDIGKKASQAATEVKTFSQMMDSLKESAQSGWAQTWEIIFGDFYEGKKLWTTLYNVIDKTLGKISDVRNNLLKGVFNSKWDQLVEKVNKAGISTEDFSNTIITLAREANLPIDDWIKEFGSLADVIKKGKIPAEIFRKAIKKLIGAEDELTGSTETVNKTIKDLDSLVKRVIRGEFGNGAERVKKLTDAGYDWATVQNKVNETLGSSVRHISKLAEAQGTSVQQLSKLSDEQLKNKGYTEDQIAAIRELKKVAEGAGSSIDDLINSMEKPSGRELLLDSFKNIWEEVQKIFKAISDAWHNVFGSDDPDAGSKKAYSMIETFHDITESMEISEESAKNFQKVMEGLFSLFQLTGSIASMSVVGGLKILNALLDLFGTNILEVAGHLAEYITKFNDWVKTHTMFGYGTMFGKIAKVLEVFIRGIKKCVDAFLSLDRVRGVITRFKNSISDLFGSFGKFNLDIFSLDSIVSALEKMFDKLESWIKGMDSAENLGVYIVQGLAKGLWSGIKLVGEAIIGVGKAVIDAICGFFGIASPAKSFITIGIHCIEGLILGFKKFGFGKVIAPIINIVKNIINAIKSFLGIHSPSTKFMEIAGDCVDGLVLGFKKATSYVGNAIKNFISGCVKIIQKIDWGKILAIGLSVGMIVGMKKLSDVMQTFIAPFAAIGTGIGSFFTNLGQGLESKFKAQALEKRSKAILNIAIAIGILVAGIAALAKIAEGGRLWEAVGALGALAGIVIALSVACALLNKAGSGLEFGLKSASLMAIGGTILMLAGSLKLLSTIDVDKVPQVMEMLLGIILGLGIFVGAVGTFVKGDAAKDIHKVGKMVQKIAWALLLMVGVIKLASMLDNNEIQRGVGVIALVELLFAGIIAISSVVKETDANKVGKMLTKMSFALLIMVGVIKLASMLSKSEVTRGIGVIAAVSVLFAGLIAVSHFAGENASKAGSMLLKIAGALLLMTWVVKIAGSMSPSELTKGAAIITAFGGIIAGLIYVSQHGGAEASKAGSMLIKAAVAMLLMSAILIILKELDPAGVGKALGIMYAMTGIFAALIYITQYAGDADKVKGTLITLTIAVGVLALALAALSFLDPADVGTAAAALTSVIGVFALLVKMTSYLKSGKKTWQRNLATILTLTLVVVALAAVIRSLASIPNPQAALVASGALSMLLLSLATSMNVISKSKSFTKGKLTQIIEAFVVLAGVMVVLGAVLYSMSALNVQNAIPNAIALSGMIYIMSMVIQNLSSLDGRKTKGLTRAASCMLILAGVMAALGVTLGIMSAMNVTNAIPNAIALSILMGVLGIATAALSGIGDKAKGLAKTAAAMLILAGVMAALAVALGIMSEMNVTNAIPNAVALSILVAVLTGVVAALALIGNLGLQNIMIGVLGLLALCVPLVAIAGILCLMKNIDNALENAKALTLLATALSLLLLPLSIVGIIYTATGGLAALGIVGLLAMCIPLLALVGILKLMQDIKNATTNAQVLIDLISVLGDVCFKLALVGPLALMGVAALSALTGLIIAIGAMAVGIGALVDKFPALQTFLDKGIPLLVQMAHGLGEMIGAFIGGIAEGIVSVLPGIGLALSQFMINATPFIVGAKMVDEQTLAGAGILVGAILALTAANFISGITSLVPFIGSFASLGTELSNFMTNAQGFITVANGIKPEGMEGIKNLAEAILVLTGANLLEGLSRLFGGESSLATFGSQLGQLGTDMSTFVTNLGSFTEDQVMTVTCASKAIKALADAASTLPNEGGWAAKICGENSLATFSGYLPGLGTDLRSFITNLGTFTEDQVTTVDCAGRAIKALADAASELPNDGGWAAKILGDNSIATFGSYLPDLGSNLNTFVTNLGTFSEDKVATVDCASKAIKALAEAASTLPNEGGLWAKIFGDNSLATFGEQLGPLGTNLNTFITNIGSFKSAQVDTVNAAVDAIKAIAKLGGINLSSTASGLITLGENLGTFGSKLASFITKMTEVSSSEITSAVEKTEELINLAKTAAKTSVDSLSTFGDSMVSVAKDGVKGFVKEFNGDSPKKTVTKAAKDMADSVIKGLENKKSDVKEAGKTLAKAASKAVGADDIVKKFKTAGKDCAEGFANGIKNNKKLATDAGSALGKAALKAAKAALDENSPSKEMYKVGAFAGEGFANALWDYESTSYDAGYSVAEYAKNGLSKAVSRINDLFNNGVDTQPTIRPVLDLSDVTAGAGTISGLFNNPSLGVMANVNSISSMMNGNQNGGNDDIVSAINKLRKDLGKVGGTTNNFNGINIGDDTNINDAVNVLVRAARIGGRS